MMRALRQGRLIWYAPDQDYGPKQSVFAPFFGVSAASVTATAKFAKAGNARILPFSHVRLPDGHYRVRIHPPLEQFPAATRWRTPPASTASLKTSSASSRISICGYTAASRPGRPAEPSLYSVRKRRKGSRARHRPLRIGVSLYGSVVVSTIADFLRSTIE